MASVAQSPATLAMELSGTRRKAGAAVRKSEWIVLAFLAYAAGLAQFLPVAPAVRDRVWLVNLALGIAYVALIRQDFARPRLWWSVMRDWLPLAVVILAYREMGWFAVSGSTHAFEWRLVAWDRMVLPPAHTVIEALGPLIPAILETAYAVVYALAPFAIAALYVAGQRKQVDRFLFVFLLGVLLCYAQFPFWPSEPPRVVFRGEDLPYYMTPIRNFNLWMLAHCGIHTSVFPSAHVAGAFATAIGLKQAGRKRKWMYRALFVVAGLIAVATVYGRYHYLGDAVAGLAMGLVAGFLGDRFLTPKLRTVYPAPRRGSMRPERPAARQSMRAV